LFLGDIKIINILIEVTSLIFLQALPKFPVYLHSCIFYIDGQWVTPSDPVYHWQSTSQLSSNSMDKVERAEDGRVYSILPAENYNLIHTKWEDDIIWDPDVSRMILWYWNGFCL